MGSASYIKRGMAAALAVAASVAKSGASQKAIPRVELMPSLPTPLLPVDWKAKAQAYDALVTDSSASGQYLPLTWVDASHVNNNIDMYGLPSYVGWSNPQVGTNHEAINCIAAVLGATLSGIDKTQSGGRDWVRALEGYYNSANGENVVINNVGGQTGSSFWYELFPQILWTEVIANYPSNGSNSTIMRACSDRWYQIEVELGGSPTTTPMSAAPDPSR